MSTQTTDAPRHPCTTARDVRTRGLEHAIEIAATTEREKYLITQIYADTKHPACRELAVLVMGDQTRAEQMAGYLDLCARNLDAAERYGACAGISEDERRDGVPGRAIAADVRGPLKTLMDRSRQPLEHRKARADLHALLAVHRERVFEKCVTKHLGAQQVLVMRGEAQRMKDQS